MSDLPKILIIDDDENVITGLRNSLELDYEVISVTSGQQGIDIYRLVDFDTIILDMEMPGMNGYETGTKLQEINPNVPIIVHTGHVKRFSEQEVKAQLHPFSYLIKGDVQSGYDNIDIDSDVLLETMVNAAVSARGMNRELQKRYEKKEEVAKIAENVAHRFNTTLPALEDAISNLSSASNALGSIFETVQDVGDYQLIASAYAHMHKSHLSDTPLDISSSKVALRKISLMQILEQYTVNTTVVAGKLSEIGMTDDQVTKIYEVILKHPQIEEKIIELLHAPFSLRVAQQQTGMIGDYVGALLPSLRHEKKGKDYVFVHEYLDTAIVPQFSSELDKRNVALSLKTRGEPHQSYLDTTLLHEPFVNIIQNGLEAIGSQGEITINTTYKQDTLQIRIENSGPAIEHPEHIFSREYSTKENGSGIGLDVTRQNIERLGGSLCVESSPVAFIIELPYKQQDLNTTKE